MTNERPSMLTWIYATGAVVLVLITIFAITFAVQEHNDRVLSDEITGTASDLQDTGARITSIRDAEMKDMNDYIRAYSEITPLLDAYQSVVHVADFLQWGRRSRVGDLATHLATDLEIRLQLSRC